MTSLSVMRPHADAHRGVLLSREVAERADELLVTRRGETQRVGPLREGPREHRGARVLGEGVPRVGGDRHRDAETSGCRELLQTVVRPHGDHRLEEEPDLLNRMSLGF